MKFLGVSFVALLAITSVYGEICTKPEVTASAYVTEDAMIHTTVAFTTQFVLKCSNGAKNIPLYAEIDGKTVPAVHLSTDNKYQVNKQQLMLYIYKGYEQKFLTSSTRF